jgi:hypothetical protein
VLQLSSTKLLPTERCFFNLGVRVQPKGKTYAVLASWDTADNHGSIGVSPSGEFLWTEDAVYKTLTGQFISQASSRADIYEEVPPTPKWAVEYVGWRNPTAEIGERLTPKSTGNPKGLNA